MVRFKIKVPTIRVPHFAILRALLPLNTYLNTPLNVGNFLHPFSVLVPLDHTWAPLPPPIGEGIRNTQPISRGLRKFWPETWKFALKIVKSKQNFKISSPATPIGTAGDILYVYLSVFFMFSCLYSTFNAPESYAKISAARFTILHIDKSIRRIFAYPFH